MKQSDSKQLIKKSKDTLVGDIEKAYKIDFGVRADMKLGTYLKKNGLPSLAKVLAKVRK